MTVASHTFAKETSWGTPIRSVHAARNEFCRFSNISTTWTEGGGEGHLVDVGLKTWAHLQQEVVGLVVGVGQERAD